MVARQKLILYDYELQTVMLPDKAGKPVQGIRITIFGKYFPQRALKPEILVGDQLANMVVISRDQRTIRGYLFEVPSDGASIRVRYGESQEGELERRFDRKRIRPLPRQCE